MLLNQDGRQGAGNFGIVISFCLALDPGRIGFASRPFSGSVPLPFGFRCGDLGLTLGLHQFVPFLLGLLLFDLLGFDRFLIGWIERNIGQGYLP